MNKIYKVIWNKAKNCYVVVSEIAKAHSKGGSTVRRVPHVGTVLITMLMASVLNLGISAPVWADPPDTGANYYGVNASDNPVTPAPDHPTNENGDGAIGAHAIAAGENAVAIGAKSISIGFGVNASDVSSISILPANIPGETIRSIRKFDANGELILNNNKPVYYTPSEWKDTSFTDEMRTTALLNEFNYRRKEGGEASIAIGNETFSLKNDVVIGNSAQALGYDAVVIGRETTGFDNSVALGTLASAATNSIAIGGVAIDNSSAAQATANYSIAIGNQARATQSNATALGIGAKASTENAIAIGLKANNTNNDFNGILLPEIGNTNNSNNTIVREFGSDGKPTGKYYTRDQWRSFDDSTKKNYLGLELNQRLKDRDDPANSYTYRSSISIGESTNALKEQAVSIGSTSIAAGSRSIAVGRKARAIANDSISVGTEALTGAIYATAIGDLSKALGDRSNALGYSAKAQGSDSTAIGSSANAQGDNSNAIGRNANAQGGNSNALGYSAKAQGGSSTAIGYSANASGSDAVAFGTYAKAENKDTIAIGHATASDEYSIAIGSKNSNKYYTQASGKQSIAIGVGTQTFKANSVALGNGAKSYGYQSSTVGFHSYSFGDESTVFGHDSTAHGRAASVFGYISSAGAVTLLKGDKDQNYQDTWSRIRAVKAEEDTEGNITYTRLGNRSAGTGDDGPNEYEIVTTVSGQVVALKRDTAERPQNADGTVPPDYYKITELRTVSNLKSETGATISNPKGYWFVVDTSDEGKIDDIKTYGGQTEGGVAFGDYANAVGNKSLAVGRSTVADGNDSAAIGMFANSYGSGSMAYGQYTSTGLVELISGDDIRHTTSLKTPSNKNESAAVYRRLVNGESALLNKLNEYVMNDVMYYETTSGTNTTKTLVPVKMNAKGELVGYWTGGTASSDEDYLNPDNWSAVSVTIKKDNKTATLDTETNRYYTGNSSNKTYLNDTDELNFEVTFTDGTTKILKAQAGSVLLSEGGVAMGAYAHAEGDRSLALGRVSGAYDKNTTAVGLYANAVGEGAMALGHNATAGAKVTVEEMDADIHTTSMNLDGGSPVRSGGIGGIAIGSYAHAEGDRAISVGRASGAYDKNSTAIGLYSNAFGEGAMAIGHNATAGAKVTINEDNPDYHTAVMTLQDGTGIRSTMADGTETKGGIAIGSYAHAVGDRAIAFGRVSGAFGDNSTAMGIYSNALGQGAIAIGHGSSTGVKVKVNEGGADDFWTTELETNTTTDNNPVSNGNDGGIAIGSYAHTEGTRALAVGRVAGAYGTNSTVVGLRSNAYGEGSIAFGHGVTAGSESQKYTTQLEALHNDPTIPYDLDGEETSYTDASGNTKTVTIDPSNVVGAVAIGSYAEATGRGSLSVGRYSKASSAYSTTLGIRASVLESAENAIAIGREAKVEALYDDRTYAGMNSIAVGTLTNVKGQNSIAIGTADMLNVSEDGTESIVAAAARKPTTISGDKSIAIGMNDTVVGTSSIAIGTGNVVQGDRSGAIGDPNTVNGKNSYILGNNSTIGTINSGAGTEGSTGGDTGSDSGDDTEGDTGSTSGGSSASADIPIDNAFITGNNSIVLSEGGLIYGSDAKIEAGAANGLALGNNTIVSVPGAVALGSTSVAKRAAGAGGAGFDPATGTNHVVGEGENNATWISTLGAVSVGGNESVTDANIGTAATETRQITGVAAGTADTDAVNVAQLKLVQASAGGGTLKFGGDNTTPDTYIIRNSGQALDIKGGANQSNLTESNIAVISNGADKLEVKLSDKIQLTNAGDLTIGTDADDERTTVYQKGIKIEPKSGTNSVMFTTEGISAGGQKIENVADGVALTDAVNVGQLKNARTVVTEGANVKVTKSENGSTWADSYKIDVDNLTYKSTSNNTTTTKSVALATGLNFTDGTNTTAEIADDGVVKFHVSNTAIQEAAAATDKYVTGGSASYGTDGASAEGTVTLTRANAEDVTISGLKNTYTTVTKDATAKTVTFSRNDGVPDTVISLSDLGGSSTDYRLVGAGVSYGEAYTVSGDGTLSLNVQDQMNPDRVNQITINGIATPKDVAAATTEVEGGTNVSVATDTTTAADGHTIYTVNADGAKVSKGSEAVTVTGTKDTTTNITDYVVDLSETTKATLDKAENNGLTFAGDSGTSSKIKLGDTLSVKGEAAGALTSGNIGVEAAGDTLKIKLAKEVKDVDSIQVNKTVKVGDNITMDGTSTTVTVGDTSIDSNGITIAPASGSVLTKFTKNGISAGNQKIEYVAAGSTDTDAVNVGQLKNARTVVTEGANVKVTKSENGSTWADSYKIDVDNLTYKSTSNNTTTTKSVALATGLNFTDGTNTTAEIADDGVVKFHVSNTAIQEAAAATDKYVTGGSASYGTDGASAEGTVTLTRANAEDVTISGLKNTYTTVTKDATAKTVTFSRNDGVPDTVISLSDLGGSSTDYRLVGAGVSYGEAYTVSGDGTLSLNVQDQMNPDRVNQITINGIATPKDVAAATTEVEGGTNVSVATDTTTAADGHTIYTVNADGAKVSKGSEAVTVTGTKDTTTNITDYVVDLSETTKATLDKAENNGLTFAGDSGTSSKIKLGDTLSVKGEAAGALTSGNIGVEAAGDTLKIKLAKEVKDVDSIQVNKTVKVGDNITMDGEAQNVTIGSLADGGTVINQKGIRIVPASGDDITEFTTENISAGNQQIHKVKAGEAETDAVNVKQLNDTAAAAKSEVKGGANVASVDVDTTTAKDGHTIYTVNVDDLTYKANGKNGKSVSLADGLNFVDGANTTAVVDEDGVVTFNTDDLAYKVGKNDAKTVALSKGLHFVDGVNTTAVLNDDGSIQFDGYKTTVQKKAGEGNMAEVSAATSADGLTTVYDIAVADMHVDSGMVAYGEDGKAAEGSITLTHKDGTETTIRGLKNTYTTVTKDNNTVTFSRNDGVTETISLSDLGATDYRLIPASDGTYKVNSDGTLTLQVKDAMNEKAAAIDVKIEDVATKTQQDINTQNISTNADNIRTNASNIQKNRDDLDAGWNAKVGENTINVNPEHNDLTFAAADEHVTVTAEGRTIKVGVQNLADTDLSNITEDGKTVITNIARDAITVEGEGGIEVTQSTDKSKYTVKTKLSDNLTLREGNIDLANKLKIGNGTDMHTVTIDGEAGEVTGLTNKTLEADGFGTVGRAATEEQLALVNTEAAKHATVVEGDNVKVTTGTNASGGVEYKVSSIRVESGTSDYRTVTDTNNKGKLTFTDTEGDTFDVEVRDTYTTGVTYDATNKKATFTRNDGNSYELSLKDMGATDYRLVKNASSTDGSYKMADDGTVTMVVQDQLNPGNTEQVTISGLTTKADVAAAKAEVKAGTNVSVATDTKTAEDGHTIYTVNADGASASAGSDAVKVTKGTKDTETNITDYAIDLSDATKATLSKVETRGLTFKGDSGSSEEIKLGDTLNVTGGATGTLTEGNIGVEAEGNALKVKLADNINLTKAGSVTIGTAAEGATVISQKGIRIIPATGDDITEFTTENISAGGQQIHKVKAGTADDDAVNVRQLNEAKEEAIGSVKLKFRGDNGDEVVRGNNETLQVVGDGSNITTESEDNKIKVELSKDLKVDSVTAGNTVINNDGVTADKVTVGDTVIEDGKVSVGDTTIEENKIAMGDTLITNDSVTTKSVTADEVTAGDTTINNDGVTTNKVTAGDTTINNDGVTTNKVTVGDTTVNSDGLTIDGGPSVTKDGIDAGGKKITNVAAGTADTDAVNVAQLREATAGSKTEVAGGTNIASVEKETATDGHTIYTVNADGASVSAGSEAVTVTKGAKDTTTNITDYKVDLSDTAKASLDKVDKDGLTFAGDSGTSNKIKLGDTLNVTGGATGALSDGNIGVEGSGDTLKIKLAKDVKDVDSIQINKTAKVGDNITLDGENTKLTVGDTAIEDNKMTMGDTLITNNGVTANTFTAGDTVITNDGVTANTFTAGDTTISNDGLAIADGPSVTKNGVNAGGQKVTGVAPGEEDTDAANIGQLRELADNAGAAINNVGNEVNRLDGRMKKGLAGAAALAALHPMDFDPDDKLTFAAGVGNYRGQNAAAIGAFYRPDEKVMFSVGGTVGNGENMVNAGVSFALDRVNRVTTSRTAMAHEIVELKKHIAHQDSQIAQLTQLVNKLVGPEQQIQNTAMFPDVPENHWAYAYLEDLQQRGIVEGYPGGRFIGDRAMTRYEFAAMLDRALQKGVQLDARLTKEFEPELGRIYVERIHGQDNDRHKIERVRVNNTDTRTRDVYGTKIS